MKCLSRPLWIYCSRIWVKERKVWQSRPWAAGLLKTLTLNLSKGSGSSFEIFDIKALKKESQSNNSSIAKETATVEMAVAIFSPSQTFLSQKRIREDILPVLEVLAALAVSSTTATNCPPTSLGPGESVERGNSSEMECRKRRQDQQ